MRVIEEGGAGARWGSFLTNCPVECGGGWQYITYYCQYNNNIVDKGRCDARTRPRVDKIPCATRPCP